MRIVITGAAGNLGSKLRSHLEAAEWCEKIVAIDVRGFEVGAKTEMVLADVGDPHDGRWLAPVRAADAVVHYASANPAPNGSWTEAATSFDMTMNLLEQAGGDQACRLIFASSNHAMGGYKDAPLPPDGKLRMTTPPLSGTQFYIPGQGYRYGAAYGATKIMGERAAAMRAEATGGRLTTVSMRIGYCQRGENVATTLVSSGGGGKPTEVSEQPADEQARDFKWFRNMWLSNRDHASLMEAALRADASGWPAPGIVVSGVSNNAGMAWDIAEAATWIGYRPVDDVWVDLAKAGVV